MWDINCFHNYFLIFSVNLSVSKLFSNGYITLNNIFITSSIMVKLFILKAFEKKNKFDKEYLLTDWVPVSRLGSTMRHYGCVPHNWEYSLASCELLTLMFNCVRGDRDTEQRRPPWPGHRAARDMSGRAQKQNLPVSRPRPPSTTIMFAQNFILKV